MARERSGGSKVRNWFNFVVLAILSCAAAVTVSAQHAPPASIYSIGGTQLGPPPASVYSAPTQFGRGNFGDGHSGVTVGIGGGGRGFVPQSPRHHHRFNNFNNLGGYPGYVPYYAIPYYVYSSDSAYDDSTESVAPGDYARPSDATNSADYGPRERMRYPDPNQPATAAGDSRYGEHYLDTREALRTPLGTSEAIAPAPGVTSANGSDDGTPTLLIFRDGHQSEIGNYAIMGSTLIVLSGERTRIPLDELDLAATVAANDRRGIDFHVPSAN